LKLALGLASQKSVKDPLELTAEISLTIQRSAAFGSKHPIPRLMHCISLNEKRIDSHFLIL
jgi:hypothetical protein